MRRLLVLSTAVALVGGVALVAVAGFEQRPDPGQLHGHRLEFDGDVDVIHRLRSRPGLQRRTERGGPDLD